MSTEYKLVEKRGKQLNKFKVTIKADSNDADYVTETMFYGKSEFEEYIIDALVDLKYNYSGHHDLENYPNESDLYIPYNGWDGYCHTLEELTVEFIDGDGKVWDVEF
jgi:hypothetical protein